jgi:hypothetical protein
MDGDQGFPTHEPNEAMKEESKKCINVETSGAYGEEW